MTVFRDWRYTIWERWQHTREKSINNEQGMRILDSEIMYTDEILNGDLELVIISLKYLCDNISRKY